MVAKKSSAAPEKPAPKKKAATKKTPALSEKAVERLLDKAVERPTRANVDAALAGAGLERVNGEGLLFHVCAAGEGALPLVEHLLAAGADPNAPAMPRWSCKRPLQGLFEAREEVPSDEAHALTLRLLEAGAAPDLVDAEGSTALAGAVVAASPLVELLWDRSSHPTRVDGVLAAIGNAGEYGFNGTVDERLARARELLAKLDDPDAAAPSGLTPLMQVVVSANPKLLGELLERSKQPAKTLEREVTLAVPQAVPAGGGIHPELKLQAGLTARGVGVRLEALIAKEAKRDGKNPTSFIAKQRTKHLEALREVLSVLAARKLPEGEARAAERPLPPFLAPVHEALLAAARASGTESARAEQALATVEWEDLGPLGYLKAAVQRLDGMLTVRPDPPPEGIGRWLVEICAARDLDDVANRSEREEEGDAEDVVWVDPWDYPEAAQKIVRKALGAGTLLACAGDDLLIGVKTADAKYRRDGTMEQPAGVKVLEVRRDGTTELGRDLSAFVQAAARDCGLLA